MKLELKYIYPVGLAVLIFSNICLLDLSVIKIYILLSAVAIAFVFFADLYQSKFILHIDPCIKWLTIIYFIFEIYGIFFLRYGEYNWDFQLFNYVSNIALYICLKRILFDDDWKKIFFVTIEVSTVVTLIYFLKSEISNLFSVGVRIGGSLSGNVNTVGECLGVISFLLAFLYYQKRNIITFGVFVATCVCMLITGSKMTIFCILIDFLLLYKLDKSGFGKWIKYAILFCFVIVAIFNIPYLYNIIGHRLEAMLLQLFGHGTVEVSHSTNDRLNMIIDGLRIFPTRPIFGGGEKYFAYMSTQYGFYGYSHCNYVEMLCNFGIVGTLIYYLPIIRNTQYCFRRRKSVKELAWLNTLFLTMRFILDFMSVTHSDVCINYIPMLLSFVLVKKIRNEENGYV